MKLILASQSQTRQRLLTEANISFISTAHAFDERSLDEKNVAPQVMARILAEKKALHALIPHSIEEEAFILGVDTIVYDDNNIIYHKPKNFEAAYLLLEQANNTTVHVVTGLSYACYDHNNKKIIPIKTTTTITDIVLSYPPHFIQKYLEQHKEIFTHVAGGLIIEGFGAQYIKEIHGSYTGALGLPINELITFLQEYNK